MICIYYMGFQNLWRIPFFNRLDHLRLLYFKKSGLKMCGRIFFLVFLEKLEENIFQCKCLKLYCTQYKFVHECLTLMSRITTVQVSDTTMLNSSNTAGSPKKIS